MEETSVVIRLEICNDGPMVLAVADDVFLSHMDESTNEGKEPMGE